MSQKLSDFERSVHAQFDRANHQLREIAILWQLKMAAEVIVTCPGPNNQYPYDTEYIATGRLRASFSYSNDKLAEATRWDGGPYTEHGDDTLAAYEAALRSRPIQRMGYFQSDIAYAEIVHQGYGRHKIARPWVWKVGTMAAHFRAEAVAEVMARP